MPCGWALEITIAARVRGEETIAKRNAVSSGYCPILWDASRLDFAEALRYGTYMQCSGAAHAMKGTRMNDGLEAFLTAP
jgi:hypothetical protein